MGAILPVQHVGLDPDRHSPRKVRHPAGRGLERRSIEKGARRERIAPGPAHKGSRKDYSRVRMTEKALTMAQMSSPTLRSSLLTDSSVMSEVILVPSARSTTTSAAI